MNDRPDEVPTVEDGQEKLKLQSFAEVTELLDVAPGTLRRWIQRFGLHLDNPQTDASSLYGASDVETLSIIRGMLAEGNSHEQIDQRLRGMQTASTAFGGRPESEERATISTGGIPRLPQAVSDVASTIAATQRSILNGQGTMRELVGVIVQDNFSLKEENRKLRERMLELERSLAEYRRQEEGHKERLEGRLRAIEATLGALQQQIAYWVQLQRERKRWWWFG